MKFIRDTHDKKGNFRGYNYFELFPDSPNTIYDYSLHMIDDTPQTIDDILYRIKVYNQLYPDATLSEDIELLAISLIRLYEAKYIKIVV